MISVKVSYTVDPGFVEKNQQHIHTFLADFKKLSHLNFLYHVFLQSDGVTFMHVSMYENEATQNEVLNTPSFLNFQKERDESGLNNSHAFEALSFVGSSIGVV